MATIYPLDGPSGPSIVAAFLTVSRFLSFPRESSSHPGLSSNGRYGVVSVTVTAAGPTFWHCLPVPSSWPQ